MSLKTDICDSLTIAAQDCCPDKLKWGHLGTWLCNHICHHRKPEVSHVTRIIKFYNEQGL